jgi:hypothetical protein
MKNYSSYTLAFLAGGSLLAMAIVAGFAYGYAFQHIYNADDVSATVANLEASPMLFRWLVFSFAAILILDVVAAWALYFLFRAGNQALSLLSAWLRLVYAGLLGIALSGLTGILHQLPDGRQHPDAVMEGFRFFVDNWSVALMVFGCHLFTLGIVALGSRTVPRVLAILLLVASVCYFAENAAHLLDPGYSKYADLLSGILAFPMALGELGLAVWLLAKGGRMPSAAPIRKNPLPDPAQ